MDNRCFSRKVAFGHNYTYYTRERPCRTNKLQTNSANKLPLQNIRENDKQNVWYFESNNLIKFQSGFRAERSTNDNLVRLETFIRNAFIKREHVVDVFFELEKAYDTPWRYGILKDLHNFGLKGRLPNFIQSFLEDRTIQVRVGSTLSDLYDQEQGVPQGAILSTTLFNVKINDIINCLDYKTDGLMVR